MAKKLGSSIRPPAVLLAPLLLAKQTEGLRKSEAAGVLFGVIVGWMPLIYLCSCSPSPAETALPGANASTQFDETNPLGANAACYVCHITFVKEELSKTHLRAEITCVHCHGLSAGHANDEDIGATPPDVSFKRDQVNVMCLKCHKSHDIPPEEVVVGPAFPKGGAGESPSVCTDCHGAHKIKTPYLRMGNTTHVSVWQRE